MRFLATQVGDKITTVVSTTIEDWFLPVGVLAFAILAVWGVRIILRRLGKSSRLHWMRELAPALSNLVYLLGLRAFVDLAPLPPKAEFWLEHITYVIGALLILSLARRAAMMAIEWGVSRSEGSSNLHKLGFIPLIRNLVTVFVFAMGGITLLRHFDYDVLSILTALGVGSLAVGLAAKDTLANMISGFVIIIDRNLAPGDVIEVGGKSGEVEEIGLRTTRINLGNGTIYIVPNSDMVNNRILNRSEHSRAMAVSTQFRVPYEVPFARIRQICLEVVDEVSLVRAGNSGKWTQLKSLDQGSQLVGAGFWITDLGQEGAALSDFNERLQARLAREGVSFSTAPGWVAPPA